MGGKTSTGTVTLGTATPVGGVSIGQLSNYIAGDCSDDRHGRGEKKTTTFTVMTVGVSSQGSAARTATLGNTSKPAELTITLATLSSLKVSHLSEADGSSATGAVSLTGPAPTGGTVIRLASNEPAASVPPTVIVPGGQTSTTFVASTTTAKVQTEVKISARFGLTTKAGALKAEL